MKYIDITGYCDRPNVRPGENLKFFVSCKNDAQQYSASLVRMVNGDPNPAGPGPKENEVVSNIDGEYVGFPQRTTTGSFVEVPVVTGALDLSAGGTLHAFIQPTTPHLLQTVISKWDDVTKSGWALQIDKGRLVFVIADNGKTQRVSCASGLFPETWYSVVVSVNTESKTVFLSQFQLVNRVNSRLGCVSAIKSDDSVSATLDVNPVETQSPFVIAGINCGRDGDDNHVKGHFNGKLENPKIFSDMDITLEDLHGGGLPSALIACWDFSKYITRNGIGTDKVSDVSGNGYDGFAVNQPDMGMTGRNWDGHEENFIHCPEQYGAFWFHEDSLDDCRWKPSFELEIPTNLLSGIYAVRLVSHGQVDWIPFFVAPPLGTATAKVALLMPTFSYLAYANTQVMQTSALAQPVIGIITTLSDHDLELGEFSKEYGLSHYDVHCDGRGVMYSSWRRPIFNMRPNHRHEYGSIWQFPADLHLVDWLEEKGVKYDIITDHDLLNEGSDVLGHYNVVMTGTHPEYYSGKMLDAWEDYIGGGGRGMYMGGNGFYWIATPHPEKPWVVEVRRGESGDQAWRGKPGELHHSTTGERGGIWRHRARAPQKIWGTGYGSHGLDVSTYYHQMPDAADPRLAWIMENVAKDERVGDFGLVNGGAAGLEMDRIDYSLGSPPNTMLIGSSIGHSANAMLVPEDIYFAHPGTNGEEDPLVRSDLVFASSTNGGAVFSVSSMAWCGSLSHNDYNNNVSTITLNVINRFSVDGPVEEVV